MRKAEVSIGRTYAVKVSGRVCPVRLESESGYGGWNGRNLQTGRDVRVKTAGRLRFEVIPDGRYWREATLGGRARMMRVVR